MSVGMHICLVYDWLCNVDMSNITSIASTPVLIVLSFKLDEEISLNLDT